MHVARFLLGSVLTAGALAACSSDIPSGNIPFAALVSTEAGASNDNAADGGTNETDGATDEVASYTVGGTVTGLAAGDSVVLENNGAGDVTVAADGTFTFGAVPSGTAYAVTVKTAPTTNKYCAIHDSAGTVGTTDVALTVTCALLPTYAGGYVDRGGLGLVGANTLHGSQITFAAASSVTAFGVIGRAGGPHVKMALYTDSGGKPSKLVASTDGSALVSGRLEIPVKATPVAAGTYWVMAVYDTVASYGQQNVTVTSASSSQTYGSALPATYPSGSTYRGNALNYYVIYQ